MNKGFDFAQMVYDILSQPEPQIIGRCVYCERDIYQCESYPIRIIEKDGEK